MPRLRRVGVGLLLVAGSVVLGLAAAEVVLRVTHLAPAAGVHTVDQQEFERVPGLFGPGQRLVDRRHRALPHRVTINQLGYRGAEFPREKPEGEFRIFFAGDSFTYGDFVDDSLTLPVLVEGELTARRCRAVRVVNGGVGGTTIVTQAALVARATAIRPDLVVLGFYENDLVDLTDPLWGHLEANRRRKSSFPLGLIYPHVRDLALWNAALQARAALRVRAQEANLPYVNTRRTVPAHLAREYRQRLRALRDSLERQGVPLVLTAFPDHLSLYSDTAATLMHWIAAAADSEAVPFVDLFSRLRTSGRSITDLYLMPHDGHFSPAGNRLAAGVLASYLAALPPLAERCGDPSSAPSR